MEFRIGDDLTFLAKVENVNISDNRDYGNINVTLNDKKQVNIKLNSDYYDFFQTGKVYWFHVSVEQNEIRDRVDIKCIESISIYEYYKDQPLELSNAFNQFYAFAPVDVEEIRKHIESIIDKIQNKIIYDITNTLYHKYVSRFYLYPAATKFHHAYIGGLAYHTNSMLELAELLCKYYSYVDSDYVYAGIILHDIMKVEEFSDAEGPEYTVKGLLLGHISMSAAEIHRTACELGYEGSEEETLLQHVVLSHHGQPNFGSPKKPMTAEAYIVSVVDNLDSKMVVLGESLAETNPGEFTEPVNVLDKLKFYKPHHTNK